MKGYLLFFVDSLFFLKIMNKEVYILYVKIKFNGDDWYEISWNIDRERLSKLKKDLEHYARYQEFKIESETRNLKELENARFEQRTHRAD
jgi:hypothetical protein